MVSLLLGPLATLLIRALRAPTEVPASIGRVEWVTVAIVVLRARSGSSGSWRLGWPPRHM